jgi:hypothetical protein
MATKKPKKSILDIVKNVAIIVLIVLVVWMILGKPWPSQIKTDKDRFTESISFNGSGGSVAEDNDVSSSDETDSDNIDITTAEVDSGILMDFDVYGTYKAVYDSNREMFTLGWWNENMVVSGTKNLADLKREGATISFAMPADGWINNSAGELFIDDESWDLGNYGEDPQQATMIKAGQTVTVSYGPNNNSAGFQLWFDN